jgi:hypothetical protein
MPEINVNELLPEAVSGSRPGRLFSFRPRRRGGKMTKDTWTKIRRLLSRAVKRTRSAGSKTG